MKSNATKIYFGWEETMYLGYLVYKYGIGPLKNKLNKFENDLPLRLVKR